LITARSALQLPAGLNPQLHCPREVRPRPWFMIMGQNWRYSPPMTHDHGRGRRDARPSRAHLRITATRLRITASGARASRQDDGTAISVLITARSVKRGIRARTWITARRVRCPVSALSYAAVRGLTQGANDVTGITARSAKRSNRRRWLSPASRSSQPQGQAVLVHCADAVSRTPAVAALYSTYSTRHPGIPATAVLPGLAAFVAALGRLGAAARRAAAPGVC
jgi:hypothetical protein